ncbi:uncharacterized protein [Rutidosis leptorrhynchoides]|uniref:uncharacterized protein n=1 Tax=Rutidosis leptorrhynchoides TaxID=125765 RepID=UPI003A995E74
MVKKSNGGWRMCVDFTNINKACPKDCYPLPEIDWKMESLNGYKFKCFLDTYKGYHQIQMAKEDEEKTSFYTSKGIFCYQKMPFGLKNAGATYQRLVDKAFHKQLGRNLEAYVDDMVIKSIGETDLLTNIEETFQTLRSVNMKLNPKNCSFGIEKGRFLGFYITKKGIQARQSRPNQRAQSSNTANNEAEYEALLAGLRLARDLNIQHLKVFVDSQLVANHVTGTFKARSLTIQQYLAKSKELIKQFKGFEIEHVRRSQNKKADALSKLASITFAHLAKEVVVETLERRSIEAEEVNDLYPDEDNTWMEPIKDYLAYGLLPEDKGEARKIRIKAPSYKLQDGKLYRKSFLTPWLRCVGPSQATIIIQEMHEGVYGFHAGPRSIVAKIMRLGY